MPYSTNWSTMNLVAIIDPSWTLRWYMFSFTNAM